MFTQSLTNSAFFFSIHRKFYVTYSIRLQSTSAENKPLKSKENKMFKLKRFIVLLTVVGFILGLFGSVALAADEGGKINVNTASAEELSALKGVGEKIAANIVQFRKENGPYKSIDDLKQVKGVGTKILEDNAEKITL